MATMSLMYFQEVLLKELPWAYDYGGPDGHEFEIRTIDLDTLNAKTVAIYSAETDSWRFLNHTTFIDSQGQELKVVGEYEVYTPELEGKWWKPSSWGTRATSATKYEDEAVEQALRRDPSLMNSVRFVWETREGKTILHRLPNEAKNLASWLEEKVVEAREKLRQELST